MLLFLHSDGMVNPEKYLKKYWKEILNFCLPLINWKKFSALIEITGELQIIKKDPEDNIILETALRGNADYILSGDFHLLEVNLKLMF